MNARIQSMLTATTLLASCFLKATAQSTAPSTTNTLDAQGYVRDWLMLAPIPLPEGSQASEAILRSQVREEASLKPSDGTQTTVAGRTLTWKKVSGSTNAFDLNATLKSQNDQAVGYLVTYVECDADIPNVILSVGSSDQARIYFNGVDIYAVTEPRPMMLDTDKGRVTLRKGINTFVFKIINEQNSWQGALRFTDPAGTPVQGLRIRTAP